MGAGAPGPAASHVPRSVIDDPAKAPRAWRAAGVARWLDSATSMRFATSRAIRNTRRNTEGFGRHGFDAQGVVQSARKQLISFEWGRRPAGTELAQASGVTIVGR